MRKVFWLVLAGLLALLPSVASANIAWDGATH